MEYDPLLYNLGSIWIAWVQCFLSSWLLFIVLVSRGGVNTQYCYLIAPVELEENYSVDGCN